MKSSSKHIIINLIQAFCITFAVFVISGMESGNILLLLVMGLAYVLLDRLSPVDITKRTKITGIILSLLYDIFYMAGAWDNIIGGLENRLFQAVYLLLTAAGLFILFYHILVWVLAAVRDVSIAHSQNNRTFSVKIMLIYTGIVFLCMLPLFLMNYPGVMTPDSIAQYLQATGVESYSNHHPWIHTMTIRLFYNIGYGISGSVYTGLATYTIFQMILVSLSVGYAIECVYELGTGRGIRIALLLIFILCPYNLVYGITMWKDIIFSLGVLVFTIELMRILLMDCYGVRDCILLVISGIAMSEYRHNGFYGFILTALVVLIVGIVRYCRHKSREAGRHLILQGGMLLAVIIVVELINGPIMTLMSVEQPPTYLSLSIPLQQMARVVADDCDIAEDELEMLERINDLDYLRDNYQPGGSDNVCQWVNYGDSDYFSEHLGEYLGLWLRMGLEHPTEYIAAYVDQTKGYYYPMNAEQTTFYGITDNSVGLESQPLISGPAIVKLEELLYKLPSVIPVYGVLYSAGSLFWFLLLIGAIVICRGETGKLLTLLPVLGVTLTILVATPLVADLRYAYELVITLPYLAVISLNCYTRSDV